MNFNIVYNSDTQEFIFKGKFYFGYMGTFSDDKVCINLESCLEDIKELELIAKNGTPQALGKKLTEYYQLREQNIIRDIEYINNQFLNYIFIDGMIDCDFEFWKADRNGNLPSFLVVDKLPKTNDIDISELIYTDELHNEFSKVQNYYSIPHLFEQRKEYEPDIHSLIKKYFPMIDLKILLSHIYPDYLTLDGNFISVQCSSPDCDNGIACSAYAMVDSNNYFYKWDNF